MSQQAVDALSATSLNGVMALNAAERISIRHALSVRTPDGQRLFDAVQATWNLLEPSAGQALQDALQHDADLHACQVRPQAVVRAVAPAELVGGVGSPDVESVRVGEHRLVAVGARV